MTSNGNVYDPPESVLHPAFKSDIERESVSEDENLGRPVRVRWIDSGLAVHDGWMQTADMPSSVERVETVGLWMGENDEVVMVGGTRDSANHSWLNCQLIYKPCILIVEWLS